MALVIKEADLSEAPVVGGDFARLPSIDDVRAQAKAKGIDPEFAVSIYQQESGGNPKVKDSAKGAKGGMQVIPATFTSMMGDDGDINDPWDNLEAGLRYIQYGQKKVGNDLKLLAAGYHQGYGHPDLQRGVIANTSDGRVSTPDYARQVVQRMGVKGNTIVAPTPLGGGEREADTVSVDPQDRFMVELARDGLRLKGTTSTSAESLRQAEKDVPLLDNLFDLGKTLKIGVNVAAQDLRELTRRIPVAGPSIVDALDKVDQYFTGKGGGTLLPDDDAAMTASMTGKMQAALQRKWWDSDKSSFGDAWLDWRSYAGGLMQSLPEQALTMVPAMRLAKGVYASKLAAGEAAGLTATAAAEKAGLAAARTAAVSGGVLEGTLQGAQSSRQVRDDILKMSESDLKDSDIVKALMGQGMSFTEARAQVADDAATKAFILAGVATAMFAGTGDYVLAKAIVGQLKGGIGARIAKGAVAEGVLEEFPQSGLSQAAQNLAMRDADPATPLSKDVLNQALGGLAIGAVQGGGQTAIFGRGGERGAAPAERPSDRAARGIRLDSDTGAVPASDVFGGPVRGEDTGRTTMGATSAIGEAAKSLMEPLNLSNLDRVEAIDKRLGELAADLAGVAQGEPEAGALEAERDSLVEERAGLAKGFPKVVPGAETTFQTESGAELRAVYGLVEAQALVTSHDENLRPTSAYPQDLQPRERERAASEVQVSSISQRLNPARLGASADAATGAPIIGGDGVVESGNARTIALKRVYQANGQKAEDYRAFLTQNADRFGLTSAQVAGMQQPVLVRVRKTPVNRAEFARQANAPTTATMSPSETARADAKRLDNLDDVVLGERGEIPRAKNAGFIKRFVSGLPLTEQTGLVAADGELSQAGVMRIRNAILGRAYGDSPALMRMVESLDNNLRNVTTALMRVAPQVAKARDSIKDGALHDADITTDLVAAVEELSKIRERGHTVAAVLAQSEMFGLTLTPEGVDLLQFLDANMRYPNKIAQFIENYLEALGAAGSPAQSSLLGAGTAPAKGDIITAAKGRLANEEPVGAVPAREEPKPAEAAASAASDGGTDEGAGAQPLAPDAAGAQERAGARSDQGGALEDVASAKAAAQAEFDAALGELGEFIEQLPGATMKFLPEEERKKLIPVLTKLFTAAAKLGYITFKESSAHVLKAINAN
ncbi:MAG: transglycosylase SLT domain-containing protein, partial [Pseudomonadota bacterium]